MKDDDNTDGYDNSGQAFEADLDAITDTENGIKEEDEEED